MSEPKEIEVAGPDTAQAALELRRKYEQARQVELPDMDEQYKSDGKAWLANHRGSLTGWGSLPESEERRLVIDCRERQLRAALAELEQVKGERDEAQKHLEGTEIMLAKAERGLSYASHYFDSPGSFSDDEFRSVANEIYAAKERRNYAEVYLGKVPHLAERGEAEAELAALREEIARLRNALIKIATGVVGISPRCGCAHDTEACCTKVDLWCPECIAATALAVEPKEGTQGGAK